MWEIKEWMKHEISSCWNSCWALRKIVFLMQLTDLHKVEVTFLTNIWNQHILLYNLHLLRVTSLIVTMLLINVDCHLYATNVSYITSKSGFRNENKMSVLHLDGIHVWIQLLIPLVCLFFFLKGKISPWSWVGWWVNWWSLTASCLCCLDDIFFWCSCVAGMSYSTMQVSSLYPLTSLTYTEEKYFV